MQILFMHSGLTITGSITYARALEHAWAGMHRIYWANDGLGIDERRGLVLALRHKFIPHGLHHVFQLQRFIRQKNIQLIHAHSRQANLAAALASKVTGVPYVTTAHMRTQPRAGNRLWPCWGGRTIAICETIATHLHTENGVPQERIHLIRNGIDTDFFQPWTSSTPHARQVTILGRLSGKRWHAVDFLISMLPQVLAAYPDVRFRFVGEAAPEHRATLERWLREFNVGTGRLVLEFTGHVEDPRPYLADSGLVIAAGRSLMEAMAMGIPTIAVGEQSAIGLLTPANFVEAQKTNFGDFPLPGTEGFHAEPVLAGMHAVLGGRVDRAHLGAWGRERIHRDYGLTTIARQVDRVYAEACAH